MEPSTSETVENDFGPAFEVEHGLSDDLTVWFHKFEWGDGETKGRKLSPDQARRFAQVLEEYAQMVEPKSHA